MFLRNVVHPNMKKKIYMKYEFANVYLARP